MKWRVIWIGLLVIVALATASAGYVAWRGHFDLGQGAVAQAKPVDAAPSPVAAMPQRPAPKAVTDETSHDFGLLEPGESCEYEFEIRNEGEVPLVLERGPTSCTCTMSALPQNEIPPGMAVKVKVSSKVELKEEHFSHQAKILTNDPQRPSIDLTVSGRVRTVLAANHPRVNFYTLANEKPPQQETLIYSREWPEFSVAGIEGSLPGATWEIRPADDDALRTYGAKSGYVIAVEMPPQEKHGYYTLRLNVTAVGARRSGTASETAASVVEHPLELEFVHRVKAGFSLSGDKLQWHNSTVNLGSTFVGGGATQFLLLAVRSPDALHVEKIESDPTWLDVSLEPMAGQREGTQLFRIRLEVPQDAPPCNYRTESGWVRIHTDNPAAEKVEFKVSFAVARRH